MIDPPIEPAGAALSAAVPRPGAPRRHILTAAVEDYFQSGVLHRIVPLEHWRRFETRVAANTRAALDLLDAHDAKATFFVLGWIAEELPEVVREIVDRGHELASKGFVHRAFASMDATEFREDVVRTREALERASGLRVFGHRVAMGSIAPRDAWALDILADEGFVYDSSFYPRFRDTSREPFRRFPHLHRHGDREIWEFPLSTWGWSQFLLPAAGGNYFRQIPRRVMERAVAAWDTRYKAPFNMYFNVWELDRDLPRISAVGPLSRIRQYRNLGKMSDILEYYFERYRFGSIAQHLELETQSVAAAPSAPSAPEPQVERVEIAPARRAEAEREDVTIVIPCFNEEPTLPYLSKTLEAVQEQLAPNYRLRYLFVDDCSTDRTWIRLEDLFGARPDCQLLRHEVNRGVAAAILTGLRAAQTEIVCSIDCDCTYDPCHLSVMIPLLDEDVAMVTASPYHPEGGVRNVPSWRLALSRSLSRLYRFVLHHQLATYTSCFRVYRRSLVADIEPRHGGFLGVAEMLGLLDLRGARIVECPAVLASRMFGVSKMKTLATIRGHLGLLAHLGRQRLLGGARAASDPALRRES